MRSFVAAITCLILADVASVLAQTPIGPPGFSPGHSDDPLPTIPAPSNVFSGSADDDSADTFSSTDIGTRRRSSSAPTIHRGRIFQIPSAPVMFADEEPPLPLIWFRGEALYWWSKGGSIPIPIVTLGDPGDNVPGAIGQPGTTVLLGDQTLGPPGKGGARFTFGFSFDAARTWGFEAAYFSLANSAVSQGVFSDGSNSSALLAFPFFNPTTNSEDSTPLALPGSFAGTAILTSKSFLQGADFNLLHNMMNAHGVRVEWLGGFRYANLQEGLNFSTDSPNVFPNPPAFFRTFDQFNTNNNFYGGQLGLRASFDSPLIFVNATTKLAVGGSFESMNVTGGTFTNIGGGFTSAPGSYLSQPTNLGSTSQGNFAVMPEFNLNFGIRLRPWASIIVGYSFLYLSSVARPGDQLDRVINPSQASAINNSFPASLVGPARPELNLHTTDFWAQGLNFSLEFRF